MPQFSWHDYLMLVSFFAAIAGLILLIDEKSVKNEFEIIDSILFRMIFAYWMVYCVAVVTQAIVPDDWDVALMSIRLTGVIAYLLTLTCMLSLPLHRFSTRRQTQ